MSDVRESDVTLYTKPGCHLCEAVEQVDRSGARPRRVRRRRSATSSTTRRLRTYQHEIPVVLVNGVEIARHRMTPEELEAALGRELR